MAGRQHVGAQFARGDQQVVEFDRHVAFNAWHRRLAGDVALGEAVDHRFVEAALVVEHVMRNTDALGNAARIIDVLPRATRPFSMGGGAVVIELQRDADHVIALGLEQHGGHRGIDAAGHGDDDTGVLRAAIEIEAVWHTASYYRWRCLARNSSREANIAASPAGAAGVALAADLRPSDKPLI